MTRERSRVVREDRRNLHKDEMLTNAPGIFDLVLEFACFSSLVNEKVIKRKSP